MFKLLKKRTKQPKLKNGFPVITEEECILAKIQERKREIEETDRFLRPTVRFCASYISRKATKKLKNKGYRISKFPYIDPESGPCFEVSW